MTPKKLCALLVFLLLLLLHKPIISQALLCEEFDRENPPTLFKNNQNYIRVELQPGHSLWLESPHFTGTIMGVSTFEDRYSTSGLVKIPLGIELIIRKYCIDNIEYIFCAVCISEDELGNWAKFNSLPIKEIPVGIGCGIEDIGQIEGVAGMAGSWTAHSITIPKGMGLFGNEHVGFIIGTSEMPQHINPEPSTIVSFISGITLLLFVTFQNRTNTLKNR